MNTKAIDQKETFLSLNTIQRERLQEKVKEHSAKRENMHNLGEKQAAAFHEGCAKMATQILEEFK